MKFLICLCLATMASAGVMTGNDGYLGSVGAASSAFQASSSGDNYGTRQETRCTPYFDTVSRDHCEDYVERTCTTTQRESCNQIPDQRCRAAVSAKQVRKCFNVTEQRCTLKEDVQLETIQVPIKVQKCQRVNERVCDTVYDTSSSVKENSECINIENPQCSEVENTIFDTTCRTTTQFDCDTTYPDSTPDSGYGSSGNSVNYGSGNSGNIGSQGYPTDSTYGSSQNAYGQPQVNCRRKQDTKCYKTPRTVSVPQCSRRTERVCESVRVSIPFVNARQSCRNEEKKVCILEDRSQPKQVKTYVYTKQCSAIPRTVCENAEQKTLVPSCVAFSRNECSYSPVEQCQDSPKQHCFQVEDRIRRERCETVEVGGYGSGSATSDY